MQCHFQTFNTFDFKHYWYFWMWNLLDQTICEDLVFKIQLSLCIKGHFKNLTKLRVLGVYKQLQIQIQRWFIYHDGLSYVVDGHVWLELLITKYETLDGGHFGSIWSYIQIVTIFRDHCHENKWMMFLLVTYVYMHRILIITHMNILIHY
jgi:hypothetical protein